MMLAPLIFVLAPKGRAFAARTPAPPDSEPFARTKYLFENTLMKFPGMPGNLF